MTHYFFLHFINCMLLALKHTESHGDVNLLLPLQKFR